jgi:hypothetical protein
MSEQTTLNRRLIESKLTGEIDAGDYKIMREGVDAEIQRIQQEENALDSEASTMEELITQQDRSLWTSVESGNARASTTRLRCKRSSIQRVWCTQQTEGYFETANRRLFLQLEALFADELNIGVPDGI